MINIDIIFAFIIGISVWVINIKAYLMGIEHGKQLANGNVPKININPIKVVKQEVDTDKVAKGWDNIFSYNGEPQKEDE